ncbi:hypothetical protein ACFW7O_25995, partial [Streptomyces diastatochromogenes]
MASTSSTPAVQPPPALSEVPLGPALRAAFSQLPTGVTVITTATPAGPGGGAAPAGGGGGRAPP